MRTAFAFVASALASMLVLVLAIPSWAVASPSRASASDSTFTIDITYSPPDGGTVEPFGSFDVAAGAQQTITISPAACFHIDHVTVDGLSVGALSAYAFDNVHTNHDLTVSFARDTVRLYASAGSGGTIYPSGSVAVECGVPTTFTITPKCASDSVYVDDVYVGDLRDYTFADPRGPHTIRAVFPAQDSTSTALAALPLNGTCDMADTLVATVQGASAGLVVFYADGDYLGATAVNDGVARLIPDFPLPAGLRALQAQLVGDACAPASVSRELDYAVAASTDTAACTLAAQPDSALVGTRTTFVATITTSRTPAAWVRGSVGFYAADSLLGTATVSNGKATLSYAFTAAGNYAVWARVMDDCYATPPSSVINVALSANPSQLQLTTSANPQTLPTPVAMQAAVVTATGQLATTATGSVVFTEDTTIVARAVVQGGSAMADWPANGAGPHWVRAVYTGDGHYSPATWLFLQQVVDATTPTLVQVFEATRTASGVCIRWTFGDEGAATSIHLERSTTNQGPWVSVMGMEEIRGDTAVVCDSTALVQQALWYRLVDPSGHNYGVVAVAAVETQSSQVAIGPNPTRGPLAIVFTLSKAGSVRIALYDLAGRRLLSNAQTFRAGDHRITFDVRSRVSRPGMYFLDYATTERRVRRAIVVTP